MYAITLGFVKMDVWRRRAVEMKYGHDAHESPKNRPECCRLLSLLLPLLSAALKWSYPIKWININFLFHADLLFPLVRVFCFFFGPLLLLLLFALMLMLYTVYIIFYLLFFEWTEMFFPSSSQEKKNCSHFQFTVVFSSFTKKREKIIAPLGHYCAETNCYNNTESSTLILKYFNEFAYFAFCYFALCFSNFIVGNAHLHSTHKTSDTTTKLKWMKQKPSSEWQWNMFFFE